MKTKILKNLNTVPNKLLIVGVIVAVLAVVLVGIDFYQTAQQRSGLSENQLLKAPKENIIDYKELGGRVDISGTKNISNDSMVIQYRYVSNQEVPPETYRGLPEDITKRTPNSQSFLKSVESIDEKMQKEEYVAKFYSGQSFQKSGDKWYEIKVATTTKTAFFKQTSLTILDKTKELFGQKVLADTFYSGAGDGAVNDYQGGGGTWAGMHSATNGDFAYPSATAMSCGFYLVSTVYLSRCFIPVDTSALPDDAGINSASLVVYVTSKADDNNVDGNGFITVVQTTQASNTTLVTEDYDQCGAVSNPAEGIDSSQRKDITNIATSATTTFTLNATGTGWISKTGYTKLGLREGHDALNVSTSIGPANGTMISVSTSESSNDPYLTVTYSVAVLTPTVKINNGTIKINNGLMKLQGNN